MTEVSWIAARRGNFGEHPFQNAERFDPYASHRSRVHWNTKLPSASGI